MNTRQLPYPPPWQDVATLCAHICVSEGTLDNWIKSKDFPPARMRGGKRMWKWAEVEAWLDADGDILSEGALAARVYNATKQAAGG